jgi:predicted XRE-type DNA-binding protein
MVQISRAAFGMLEDPIPALKERLAKLIIEEIHEPNIYTAGTILGLDQPRMWDFYHGRLERFSVQKLIRILARINRRVDITITAVGPLPTDGDRKRWEANERMRQNELRWEAREQAKRERLNRANAG